MQIYGPIQDFYVWDYFVREKFLRPEVLFSSLDTFEGSESPYWRGRISTVDLLVLTSSDMLTS